MSLSDRYTRLQLRTAVRRELMDASGRWWSDSELNQYLNDWQTTLQNECELVWGTSTHTLSTSTFTATVLNPEIHRLDRMWWNNVRLSPRTSENMNGLDPYWREQSPANPYVAIEHGFGVVELWPHPSTSGLLTLEYPKVLTMPSDVSVMEVPAWTRYSAIPYCVYRAYLRFSPNQNLNLAIRYKSRWQRQLEAIKSIRDTFFPSYAPSLRPGGKYEAQILNPRPYGEVTVPTVVSLRHVDEVPTGTINGTNTTFTLTNDPDPDLSLKVWVDGVLMTQGSHYNLSGTTITFIEPYQPITNQTLFATYRYTN
jgi:hypothetical protein